MHAYTSSTALSPGISFRVQLFSSRGTSPLAPCEPLLSKLALMSVQGSFLLLTKPGGLRTRCCGSKQPRYKIKLVGRRAVLNYCTCPLREIARALHVKSTSSLLRNIYYSEPTSLWHIVSTCGKRRGMAAFQDLPSRAASASGGGSSCAATWCTI